MTVMEQMVGAVNNFFWGKFFIYVLILVGLYFSFRTKFVQVRLFGDMVRLLGEGVTDKEAKKTSVSSFQAFAMSTASRIGTGNLAGVAIAISLGGPGAVFWMWIIAMIGAGSAFIESTLAQIYKVKDKDGFRGGPAYYMEKALNARWMGIIFAILISISFGLVFNAVQANTLTLAFEGAFDIERKWFGLVIAILVAIIIFGGVKRIARVAEILVPVMAIGYLLVALFIVITNITALPGVMALIVKSAFGLEQAFGGGLGAVIMNGIKRGLFSNEAGMGSAPNAAATAAVSHPVKQGLIQTLAVFTDTILVCSATAFIILMSGVIPEGNDGIQITQQALATQVGGWAPAFVAIAILFFAFSSLISNYYYGETNIEFINVHPIFLHIYRVLVVAMIMFGSVAKIGLVWDLGDFFMAFMGLFNLIAIILLGKIAIAALNDYTKQRKEGKDPVFHVSNIPGLKNVECWGSYDDIKQKEQ